MSIDVTDRHILTLLQRDGKMTSAELAGAIGLSQSAAHRRVRQLEETGVVTGYTATVDHKAAGLTVLGYVTVDMESHAEDLLAAFRRGVEALSEIVACYAISGSGDYLLKVAARDMDGYADVTLKSIARLPGVKALHSNFVLSTVKTNVGWPL